MQNIFTSERVKAKDRWRSWLDFSDQHFTPMTYRPLGDSSFNVAVDVGVVGGLLVSRMTSDAFVFATTSQTIRHPRTRTDALWFNLKLAGHTSFDQHGRSTVITPGDFTIHDPNDPFEIAHTTQVDHLIVEVPRHRLEDILGTARNFTGLTMTGDLPTTVLTRSFMGDLLRVQDRLTLEAAERMASIATDLIVASIAERMAIETPKPLHGTLILQRARAYIEANLSDTDLDPPQVAAAVRVSPRYLHALFREHGRSVAAWIWQRRLETAAQRLSDPACATMALGTLAYGCGFANQSHFARRFGERYGMSPREYRHSAVIAAAAERREH